MHNQSEELFTTSAVDPTRVEWHLEEAVIMARDVLETGCERKRYQESFWYLDISLWPRKAIEIVRWMCTQYLVMRWNVNFISILLACNSGTARWKCFVPVSYCGAAQDLENSGWIMGIHPGEPKCPTFCARPFFRALANSMHRNVHRGAHRCLRVMTLKREESRWVALSSGLCLES